MLFRSGLSSAPAIALGVVEILENAGCILEKNPKFNGNRKQIHFMELSSEEKAELRWYLQSRDFIKIKDK